MYTVLYPEPVRPQRLTWSTVVWPMFRCSCNAPGMLCERSSWAGSSSPVWLPELSTEQNWVYSFFNVFHTCQCCSFRGKKSNEMRESSNDSFICKCHPEMLYFHWSDPSQSGTRVDVGSLGTWVTAAHLSLLTAVTCSSQASSFVCPPPVVPSGPSLSHRRLQVRCGPYRLPQIRWHYSDQHAG